MNWTEISVMVGLASLIIGWLKVDSSRMSSQMLELEKRLIALEVKVSMLLKDK